MQQEMNNLATTLKSVPTVLLGHASQSQSVRQVTTQEHQYHIVMLLFRP